MPDSFKTFRDPLLSIFQSVVTEVAREIDSAPKVGARSRVGLQRTMASTLPDIAAGIAQREYEHSVGGLIPGSLSRPASRELSKIGIAQVCAEWSLRYLKAMTFRDDQMLAQLEDEFVAGTCDPAWLRTLKEYRRYFDANGKRKEIPYIRAATVGPRTIEIKANSRVALMGDWGTGASPALDVLRGIANGNPDLVVHLGDIYYSGTPIECQAHFIDPINSIVRKKAPIPVYTLAGNHDMYCGGVGYYSLIAQLNPEPFTQPASFFCLRSADERWQLLAMDTGLHDDNPMTVADALTYVEEDELAWHCDRITEFSGRTILLSHHQLFSAFSPIGSRTPEGKRSPVNSLLLKNFQRMAVGDKIAAWFWGHEHTLSIYQPFAGLARGRCLGHGAVPVSIVDKIYEPLPDLCKVPALIPKTTLGTSGGVYNHGYAVLELLSDTCNATYYQATDNGTDLIYQESF